MTSTTSVTQGAEVCTALLGAGVESIAATPPPTSLPSSRLDAGWEEFAATYLREHPEISAALPGWAEEVEFSEIENDPEGTIFSFSRSVGDIELYGIGKLQDGLLHLHGGGAPNVYLPSEIDCQKSEDVAQEMLDLARDLISAAGLLRSTPKLLRRPVEVNAELQRLDV